MTSALDTTLRNPYNCPTHNLSQESAEGKANPLLSLPLDILSEITEYVHAADTPQGAAANVARWGQVAIYPHLLTHEPRIESAINNVKHQDEALVILWQRGIALRLEGRVPEMTTAREIRSWMADPNNADLLDAITDVHLINLELKVIPIEINHLRNLRVLHLENNSITQVDRRAFVGCLSLLTLHLENNSITRIDPQAFVGCGTLLELKLENNQISQIDPQTFASCLSLQVLNLNYNRIAQVDPQTFAGCGAMQQLHLENNRLSQVAPQTFIGCRALAWLFLSDNLIAQIAPQTFAGCGALQSMNLSDNQIMQIDPQTFAGCGALQRLFLANNQIAQIAPQSFAGCPFLQMLGLGGNQITQIYPQTFAGCLRLHTLYLYNNLIAQIAPQAFTGCPALQWLYINDNYSLLCMLNTDQYALSMFNAFSRYVCRSQSAALYQAVSEGEMPLSEIAERLKTLEWRNLIYEMVYLEAKAAAEQAGETLDTGGDPQWGEHHVCDDKALFCKALKRAVKEKFNRLFAEQKCAVHGAIYRIAREEAGLAPDAPAWNDPNWGENHREDNVLIFIDAIKSV